MALTTYTERSLAAGFTQQALYNELKAAMLLAGFSAPIDENGSAGSTMEVVYSWTFNASAKGTVFLRLQVSAAASPIITPTIFDTYNATSNTGTNQSTSSLALTVPNSAVLAVLAINNPEMRGVCLTTGTTDLGFIGLIRPETKPPEWDESLWPYVFIPSSVAQSLRSTAGAIQPPINAGVSSFYGPNFQGNTISNGNSLTGKADVFPFSILSCLNSSNLASYAGKFSSDLAVVQGSGRLQGDTFDNKWIYLGRNICHRFAN